MSKICIFFLSLPLFCFGHYYSQIGQDEFVHKHYFQNKIGGVFVDIGAHDGITFSNSYFFEKELCWEGLCIEPIPEVFDQLKNNRSCNCICGCVTDFEGNGDFLRVKSPYVNTEMLSGLLQKYDPRHLERVKLEIEKYGGNYETIEVKCYLINNLLNQFGYMHVDFLSIDTEGGEFEILTTIDFTQITIDVITVEDNYNDERFKVFLEPKGYILVGRKDWDLLFVRKEFLDNLEADFINSSEQGCFEGTTFSDEQLFEPTSP